MRLVLPARAVSFLGDSIAFVVLSLAIAESSQPARMMVMLIAFSLPLFALAPMAGRLVDEYDSRTVLVVAGSLQVVASLGLVVSDGFAGMIGFVLLLQAGQSVTGPSWTALVPRIVGDQLVGRAIGLQQSMSAVAGLAGAAVGGVLYDVLGYHQTLLLDTSTFALLVVVAAVVKTRRGRRYDAGAGIMVPATRQGLPTQGGWATIRSDELLRLLVPALWLFILAAEAPNVVEIFLIRDNLHASAATYGLVMAGFMLGQIAGPLLAGRVATDVGRVSWSAISAAAIGVLMVVVGVSVSVWMAAPLFVLIGAAGGALNALIATLVVTRPAEHSRGRVIATLNGTARGFSVIALVLGGLGGQMLGARTTFVICGALSVVVALVVLRTRSAAEMTGAARPVIPATMRA
jgi:MFS family permease